MKKLTAWDRKLLGNCTEYAAPMLATVSRVVIGAIRIGRRSAALFTTTVEGEHIKLAFAFLQSDSGNTFNVELTPERIHPHTLKQAAVAAREYKDAMREAVADFKEKPNGAKILFGSHYHHRG